jgi:hypothetical protein
MMSSHLPTLSAGFFRITFYMLFSITGQQVFALRQSTVDARQLDTLSMAVPVGGNTWTTNGALVTKNGISNWVSSATKIITYIHLPQRGNLNLSVNLNPGGKSTIRITIQGVSKQLTVEANAERQFFVGQWENLTPGYVAIELQGISKTAESYGTVSAYGISGTAVTNETAFVKDNADNYFYWGRRGPSVHLNYTLPATNITDFYSEITVPEGNDVIGSYFMANGFAEGYFGIQVNSASERRVLFSVWSPYQTDNPASIPPEYKITMLKKGSNVYTGEFGNEGAGGQSYLVYPWKAGNTYKFLLRGEPQGDSSTVYTAYFFAPEENRWLLIASFNRPKTNTYLKRLHSFLENFMPGTGDQSRMALYSNQWVRDTNGQWTALTAAKFTADQTARKRFRLDYAGGTQGNAFYLKNCGFFVPATPIDSRFAVEQQATAPLIDFTKLQ